jgi:hypothetical protein
VPEVEQDGEAEHLLGQLQALTTQLRVASSVVFAAT